MKKFVWKSGYILFLLQVTVMWLIIDILKSNVLPHFWSVTSLPVSLFEWIVKQYIYCKYYILHMKTVLNTFQRLRRKVFLQFCCISYILSNFVKTHLHEEKLHQFTCAFSELIICGCCFHFLRGMLRMLRKLNKSLYISNTNKTKNVQ